eukprot:GSChrysophyteH2.ASY1.ANO1.491.1 assembled CDS
MTRRSCNRCLYDKRISQEVNGEELGDEFAGYIFRITGGNDKQGFAMKQGVLSAGRTRLLLKEGNSCYRARREGERKRKSVRGCIVGPDISVINLVVKKKGDADIEGLTDSSTPKRLGPKRANKIRKLFNLTKEDDLKKHVITRTFKNKAGKEIQKRPNIQRLVTPITLKRKAARNAAKLVGLQQSRADRATYAALLQKRIAEQKDARRSEISKRRSSRKASKKE